MPLGRSPAGRHKIVTPRRAIVTGASRSGAENFGMDVVAVAIALAVFALLYLMIEGLERI